MNKTAQRVFDHIIIIMFENQYRSYVMENDYFHGLAQQGMNMANYFGVMHPSQPNYISSIAGELCNMTDDEPPPKLLPQDTIVDLIEKSPYNLDWRGYMDSYIPQNQHWSSGLIAKDEYPYVIKHNAFSSFKKIIQSESRWNKVQNEAAFFADLLNGTLPAYSWFTPNMWNDGHYLDGTGPQDKQPTERAPSLVDQAAVWLEGFFEKLKFPGSDSHFPPNTLVVVTFDEADFEANYDKPKDKKYFYDGPNQIYTVLLGDMIEPGGIAQQGYNHYSLLKTIEQNFGLGDLGKNDKHANWFRFLWDEQFQWDTPQKTPLKASEYIASGVIGDALYAVYNTTDKKLAFSSFSKGRFGESRDINVGNYDNGPLVVSSLHNDLYLAYVDLSGQLSCIKFSLQSGWDIEPQMIAEDVVKVTMTTINDHSQIMVVYSDPEGNLHSLVTNTKGEWGDPAPVGFNSKGELQLGVLGSNVMLFYQDLDSQQIMTCTYNTADFNVVKIEAGKYNGPWSNTSKNKWSPSVYPVQHFSAAAFKGTPKEKEPITQPYMGTGPIACATLDGVLHLTHMGDGNNLVLTEEFSIHGLMTPEQPISYDPTKGTATNTGYGTLIQAGWSEQHAIHGAYAHLSATMSEVNGELILLYLNEEGHIIYLKGAYNKI